jgi:hypothetical protein
MLNDNLEYSSGLNRKREAVISSHFMAKINNKNILSMHSVEEFENNVQYITVETVIAVLIPTLVSASVAFAHKRADIAKTKARERFKDYGLSNPDELRLEHFMTEAMFDKNYSRSSNKYNSRKLMSNQLAFLISRGRPIEMVIPALPFKISTPLKTRGSAPDLSEVNFLLHLYEIAYTIECLYRQVYPTLSCSYSSFSVLSDGRRFNEIIGETSDVIDKYQCSLKNLINILGISDYVKICDYTETFSKKLPSDVIGNKIKHRLEAVENYFDVMLPIFNPTDFLSSLTVAKDVEPDPEFENPEGRFVTLLKSMVYTLKYKCLDKADVTFSVSGNELYRELTRHIFEPFKIDCFTKALNAKPDNQSKEILTNQHKEQLRQAMLVELWEATILYLAEIKSDRELDHDPIIVCLPDHIRWTIHAKPGQIAIATPSACGLYVQPWAGTAVFKRAKGGMIKLCTLPVLALEGNGAIPVRVVDESGILGLGDQPLFYIYPDIDCKSVEELISLIAVSLDRKRVF